ncbi:ap2 domain transcription factor ap2ix-5 [Cystoisospora suis]|uniref:Ap2 domain transcription factor ap2ix-5 n=1 Tax=Cystoisospora suis TaxID=483139 RepID=A0A2C6L005_9APIC|nr:ap2 domain transcription factor ap2ix-5 [Cystoisospora suis]
MLWPPTPTSSSSQSSLASLLPLSQLFPLSGGSSPTSGPRLGDVSPQSPSLFGSSTSHNPPSLRAAAGLFSQQSGSFQRGGFPAGGGLATMNTPAPLSPRCPGSSGSLCLSKFFLNAPPTSPASRSKGRVTPSSSLQLTTTTAAGGDPFPLFATTSTTSEPSQDGTSPLTANSTQLAPAGRSRVAPPALLLPLTRRRSYQREPAALLGGALDCGSGASHGEEGDDPPGVLTGGTVTATTSLSQCALDFSPRLLNTPRSGRFFSRACSPTAAGLGMAASFLMAGGTSHPALLAHQQQALHALVTKGGGGEEEPSVALLRTGAGSVNSLPPACSNTPPGAKENPRAAFCQTSAASAPSVVAAECDTHLQKANEQSTSTNSARGQGARLSSAAVVGRTYSESRSVSSPLGRLGGSSSFVNRRNPPPSLLDPSFLFQSSGGSSGTTAASLLLDDNNAFCGTNSSSNAEAVVTSGCVSSPLSDPFGGVAFSSSCFSPSAAMELGGNPLSLSPAAASPTSATAAATAAHRLLVLQSAAAASSSPSGSSPLHIPLFSQRQQLLLQHQQQFRRRSSASSPAAAPPAASAGGDGLFGVLSSAVNEVLSNPRDSPAADPKGSSSCRPGGSGNGAAALPSLLLSEWSSSPVLGGGTGTSVGGGVGVSSADGECAQGGNHQSASARQDARSATCSGGVDQTENSADECKSRGCGGRREDSTRSVRHSHVNEQHLGSFVNDSENRGRNGTMTKVEPNCSALEARPRVSEKVAEQFELPRDSGCASAFFPISSYEGSQPSGRQPASSSAVWTSFSAPSDSSCFHPTSTWFNPSNAAVCGAPVESPSPAGPPRSDGSLNSSVGDTGGHAGELVGQNPDTPGESSRASRTGSENHHVGSGGSSVGGDASFCFSTVQGKDSGDDGKESPCSTTSKGSLSVCADKGAGSTVSQPSGGAGAARSGSGSAVGGDTEGSSPSSSVQRIKETSGNSSDFANAFDDAAFQQPSEDFIRYCVQKHQARWPEPQNLPGIQMEHQQRRWCASVYYRGCQHKRRFSMGRWGLLGAFYAAIEWRQSHCTKLNSLKGKCTPEGGVAGGGFGGGGVHKRKRRSSSSSNRSSSSQPTRAAEVTSDCSPGRQENLEGGPAGSGPSKNGVGQMGFFDMSPTGGRGGGQNGMGVSSGRSHVRGSEGGEGLGQEGLDVFVKHEHGGDATADFERQRSVGRECHGTHAGSEAVQLKKEPENGLGTPGAEADGLNSPPPGTRSPDRELGECMFEDESSRHQDRFRKADTGTGGTGFRERLATSDGSGSKRRRRDGDETSSDSESGSYYVLREPADPGKTAETPPECAYSSAGYGSYSSPFQLGTAQPGGITGGVTPSDSVGHGHDLVSSNFFQPHPGYSGVGPVPQEGYRDVGGLLHTSRRETDFSSSCRGETPVSCPRGPHDASFVSQPNGGMPCSYSPGIPGYSPAPGGPHTPALMLPGDQPAGCSPGLYVHSMHHPSYGQQQAPPPPHLQHSFDGVQPFHLQQPYSRNAAGGLGPSPQDLAVRGMPMFPGGMPHNMHSPPPFHHPSMGGGAAGDHPPQMYSPWCHPHPPPGPQFGMPPSYLLKPQAGPPGAPPPYGSLPSHNFCGASGGSSLMLSHSHQPSHPSGLGPQPNSSKAKGMVHMKREGGTPVTSGGGALSPEGKKSSKSGSRNANRRARTSPFSGCGPGSFSPSIGPSSYPGGGGAKPGLNGSHHPGGAQGSPTEQPAVEWYEGFRRPFGTEGRQQLLRHLRQVYNADSGYWGERLRQSNIAFSRIAYATVAELWKIAHVMDCFPIALALSNRQSAGAGAASFAEIEGLVGVSGIGSGSRSHSGGHRSGGGGGKGSNHSKGNKRNNTGGIPKNQQHRVTLPDNGVKIRGGHQDRSYTESSSSSGVIFGFDVTGDGVETRSPGDESSGSVSLCLDDSHACTTGARDCAGLLPATGVKEVGGKAGGGGETWEGREMDNAILESQSSSTSSSTSHRSASFVLDGLVSGNAGAKGSVTVSHSLRHPSNSPDSSPEAAYTPTCASLQALVAGLPSVPPDLFGSLSDSLGGEDNQILNPEDGLLDEPEGFGGDHRVEGAGNASRGENITEEENGIDPTYVMGEGNRRLQEEGGGQVKGERHRTVSPPHNVPCTEDGREGAEFGDGNGALSKYPGGAILMGKDRRKRKRVVGRGDEREKSKEEASMIALDIEDETGHNDCSVNVFADSSKPPTFVSEAVHLTAPAEVLIEKQEGESASSPSEPCSRIPFGPPVHPWGRSPVSWPSASSQLQTPSTALPVCATGTVERGEETADTLSSSSRERGTRRGVTMPVVAPSSSLPRQLERSEGKYQPSSSTARCVQVVNYEQPCKRQVWHTKGHVEAEDWPEQLYIHQGRSGGCEAGSGMNRRHPATWRPLSDDCPPTSQARLPREKDSWWCAECTSPALNSSEVDAMPGHLDRLRKEGKQQVQALGAGTEKLCSPFSQLPVTATPQASHPRNGRCQVHAAAEEDEGLSGCAQQDSDVRSRVSPLIPCPGQPSQSVVPEEAYKQQRQQEKDERRFFAHSLRPSWVETSCQGLLLRHATEAVCEEARQVPLKGGQRTCSTSYPCQSRNFTSGDRHRDDRRHWQSDKYSSILPEQLDAVSASCSRECSSSAFRAPVNQPLSQDHKNVAGVPLPPSCDCGTRSCHTEDFLSRVRGQRAPSAPRTGVCQSQGLSSLSCDVQIASLSDGQAGCRVRDTSITIPLGDDNKPACPSSSPGRLSALDCSVHLLTGEQGGRDGDRRPLLQRDKTAAREKSRQTMYNLGNRACVSPSTSRISPRPLYVFPPLSPVRRTPSPPPRSSRTWQCTPYMEAGSLSLERDAKQQARKSSCEELLSSGPLPENSSCRGDRVGVPAKKQSVKVHKKARAPGVSGGDRDTKIVANRKLQAREGRTLSGPKDTVSLGSDCCPISKERQDNKTVTSSAPDSSIGAGQRAQAVESKGALFGGNQGLCEKGEGDVRMEPATAQDAGQNYSRTFLESGTDSDVLRYLFEFLDAVDLAQVQACNRLLQAAVQSHAFRRNLLHLYRGPLTVTLCEPVTLPRDRLDIWEDPMDPPDLLPQSVIQGRCSPVLFFDRLKNEGPPPAFAGGQSFQRCGFPSGSPEVHKKKRETDRPGDVLGGGGVQLLTCGDRQAETFTSGEGIGSSRLRRREDRGVLRHHPANCGSVSVSSPSFLPCSRPRHRQLRNHRMEPPETTTSGSSRQVTSASYLCRGMASGGELTCGERQTDDNIEEEEKRERLSTFPPTNGRLLVAGGYGMFELWDHSIPMRSNEVWEYDPAAKIWGHPVAMTEAALDADDKLRFEYRDTVVLSDPSSTQVIVFGQSARSDTCWHIFDRVSVCTVPRPPAERVSPDPAKGLSLPSRIAADQFDTCHTWPTAVDAFVHFDVSGDLPERRESFASALWRAPRDGESGWVFLYGGYASAVRHLDDLYLLEIPSEPSRTATAEESGSSPPSPSVSSPAAAKRFRWHLVEWGRHFPPNPRSSRCTTRPLSPRLRVDSPALSCCSETSSASSSADEGQSRRRQEVKKRDERQEKKRDTPRNGDARGGDSRPRRAAAVQAATAWKKLLKAEGSSEMDEQQVPDEGEVTCSGGVIRTPRRNCSREREQEKSVTDDGASRHSSPVHGRTPVQRKGSRYESPQRTQEAGTARASKQRSGVSSSPEHRPSERRRKGRRKCLSVSSWEERTWRLRRPADSPAPGPRFGHSLTCIGSRLFLFGGMRGDFYKNGGGNVSSSLCGPVSPGEGSGAGDFSRVRSPKVEMGGSACSAASQRRRGPGRKTAGQSPSPSSSSVSSPTRGSTERRRGRPSRVGDHPVPSHSSSVASSGSTSGRLLMNDVWMLYRDLSCSRAVPAKRQRCCSGDIERGLDDSGDTRTADVHSSACLSTVREEGVYDVPETRGWRWKLCACKGAPPSPRSSHRAVSVGVHLLIFGGYGGRYLNSLHALNTGTLVWTTVDFSPSLPSSHRVSRVGDIIEKERAETEKGREDVGQQNAVCSGEAGVFPAAAIQEKRLAPRGRQALEDSSPSPQVTEKNATVGSFSGSTWHGSTTPSVSPEAGGKRYSLRGGQEELEATTGRCQTRRQQRRGGTAEDDSANRNSGLEVSDGNDFSRQAVKTVNGFAGGRGASSSSVENLCVERAVDGLATPTRARLGFPSASVSTSLAESSRRAGQETKENGGHNQMQGGFGGKLDSSSQLTELPIPKRMEAGLAFDEDRTLFLFGGSSRFRWQCAQHQFKDFCADCFVLRLSCGRS